PELLGLGGLGVAGGEELGDALAHEALVAGDVGLFGDGGHGRAAPGSGLGLRPGRALRATRRIPGTATTTPLHSASTSGRARTQSVAQPGLRPVPGEAHLGFGPDTRGRLRRMTMRPGPPLP